MLSFVACTVLLVVAALLYARSRDVGDPAFIQVAQWSLLFLALAVRSHRVTPVSATTHLLVIAGVLMFACGAVLGAGPRTGGRAPVSNAPPQLGSWALFAFALLLLPLYIVRLQSIAALGPTDNFLINLRFAMSADEYIALGAETDVGMFKYLSTVSTVAFAGALVPATGQRGRRVLVVASGLLALTYALLGTGRTFVFQLLMMVLAARLLQPRRNLAALAAGGVGVAALVFLGMGLLMDKIGSDDSIVEAVELYLLPGLPAFDQHVAATREFDGGVNSFRTVAAIGVKVGLPIAVPSLVKEYRYVPFPTNVYTVFRPYWDDFGVAGVVIALFLIGLLHGVIYRHAIAGRGPFVLLYILSLYPLTMQFFQDQYMSLMSQWVQFAALSFLLYQFTARRGAST